MHSIEGRSLWEFDKPPIHGFIFQFGNLTNLQHMELFFQGFVLQFADVPNVFTMKFNLIYMNPCLT